jgi:hypothetical protein
LETQEGCVYHGKADPVFDAVARFHRLELADDFRDAFFARDLFVRGRTEVEK